LINDEDEYSKTKTFHPRPMKMFATPRLGPRLEFMSSRSLENKTIGLKDYNIASLKVIISVL